MRSGDLIVKTRDVYSSRAVVIGSLLAAVLLTWGVFELGVYWGGHSRISALQEKNTLAEKLTGLEGEKRVLREQLTILKRTQEVDRQAYDEVGNTLVQLQADVLELRQEVAFYRGIVSPKERKAGLSIQSFELEAAGEARLYHYALVLTQVLKNDRFVKGVVKISVRGVKAGESLTLPFKDISLKNGAKGKFSFRYFQKIAGDIRLPEGFLPRDLVVEMRPKGRKKMTKSFPWLSIND